MRCFYILFVTQEKGMCFPLHFIDYPPVRKCVLFSTGFASFHIGSLHFHLTNTEQTCNFLDPEFSTGSSCWGLTCSLHWQKRFRFVLICMKIYPEDSVSWIFHFVFVLRPYGWSGSCHLSERLVLPLPLQRITQSSTFPEVLQAVQAVAESQQRGEQLRVCPPSPYFWFPQN
jgi:hypothetical protein